MCSINETILKSFKNTLLLEDYKTAKTVLMSNGVSLEDSEKLINLHKRLKKLNRLKPEHKDIDSLVKSNSPEELKSILNSYDSVSKSQKKAVLKDKIVAENDNWRVYKIDTPKEAYLFHGKVKWCISSGELKDANEMFYKYSKNHKNVFYFYERKFPKRDAWDYIALQRGVGEDEGYNLYWDKNDDLHKSLPDFLDVPEFNIPDVESESFESYLEKRGLHLNSEGKWEGSCDYLSLDKIPGAVENGKLTVKFGKIDGSFECNSDMETLEGCPEEVIGDFVYDGEKLKSLKGAPSIVRNNFDISSKSLTSCEGCPQTINGSIIFYNCAFENLKGVPRVIGESLRLHECKNLKKLECEIYKVGQDFDVVKCDSLISLKGSPREVNGYFCCRNCNSLKKIDSTTDVVGYDVLIDGCRALESLEGLPRKIEGNLLTYNCESVEYFDCENTSVSGQFTCSFFNKLASTRGMPYVAGNIDIDHCDSLSELVEIQNEVLGKFNIMNCKSLTSLEGLPKTIHGTLTALNLGREFTVSEIDSISKISGSVIV